MRILGLDVSSSAIGWAILDYNPTALVSPLKLVDCNFIKPPKKGSIFERLEQVEKDIDKVLTKYKPDKIGIEDIAKFFPNKSTATTIITLAIFNRTVGLYCHKSGYTPELYNVMSIRHGIKPTKVLPKKEEIPELMATLLGIKFPYQYNKKQKLLKENNDVADAIAVAYFMWMKKK